MMPHQIIPVSILLTSGLLWVGAQNVAHMPPTILEPRTHSELFVRRNQIVNLQCTAEGIPDVQYEWLWNDSTIQSNVITFDPDNGTLQINGITEREEGFFSCKAKNVYGVQEAVAVSHKTELRIARVGDFPPTPTATYTFSEGGYAMLPCDKVLSQRYGPTSFKWFQTSALVGSATYEVTSSERIFIDQEGSLHFCFTTIEDGNRTYQFAAMSSSVPEIKLGQKKQLIISRRGGGVPDKEPALEYSTHGDLLTVRRHSKAQLECFFSGYENSTRKVPSVAWYDNDNNTITSGGRYELESEGRVLIIFNVDEADEKVYLCEGSNGLGTVRGQMLLNVTSSPVWVDPLNSTTAVQGNDAELKCLARSAQSELPPGQPEWYKNGIRMGNETDPTKYLWSETRTKLVVTDVQKDRDIACFQCNVQNSVGTEYSQGCLNVILPITVTVLPKSLEQNIIKGDVANLTVIAESDPLTPVSYRWIYNNTVYEFYPIERDANSTFYSNGGSMQTKVYGVPPFVTYDPVTMEAYINTSLLTEEEYASIGGTYRREMYHQYQSFSVDIRIVAMATVTKETPAAEDRTEVVDNLGRILIAVVVSVAVLLLLVILGLFICCKSRKNRGRSRRWTTVVFKTRSARR